MRFGTLRMPLDQTALFNFTSTRTSDVFIIFCANVLICVWLIQEVKGVLSQFLFRVFWGLAPEHNFPSSLSLGRVARRARTNAHHAQIRDKRANKYTACTFRAFRASLASRNRIHFSRFQVCFYAKIYASTKGKTKGANLRVEEMHFRKSRRTSTYRFHRARSSLLESHSVRRFAQVDGVFSRDDVVGTHSVSMRFTSCGFV